MSAANPVRDIEGQCFSVHNPTLKGIDMEPTTQDIVDLVTVTVKDLGGDADSVQYSGDNILIGNKSVPISEILTNRKSPKGFLDLIKKVL